MRARSIYLSIISSISALVSGIIPLTIPLAHANDLPDIRPGLWTHETTVDGKPEGVVKHCIDKNSITQLLNAGTKMMGKSCDKPVFKKNASTFNSSVKCNLGVSRMTASSTMTGDFQSAYSFESVTSFNPPMMGKSTSVSKGSAKWVGECPADMKPGDIITPDGRKMNPEQMLSQMPDMGNLLDAANSGNLQELMKNMPNLQELQKSMGQQRR